MTRDEDLPARRAISLNDCVLLCCLPLLEQSFEEYGPHPSFAGGLILGLLISVQSTLTAAPMTSQLSPELGLRGTQCATVEAFSRAISDQPRVMGIVGHCRSCSEIEFADGFVGLLDLVSMIPANFDGVLDISVCNPRGIAPMIRKQARNCLTRISERPANGKEYLWYYTVLFAEIARLRQIWSRPCPYDGKIFGSPSRVK